MLIGPRRDLCDNKGSGFSAAIMNLIGDLLGLASPLSYSGIVDEGIHLAWTAILRAPSYYFRSDQCLRRSYEERSALSLACPACLGRGISGVSQAVIRSVESVTSV